MKMKLGNTDPVPAFITPYAISLSPATFVNMEHRVSLCLQAEGNQFHLLGGGTNPPWLWSASDLCRPSDRRLLAK
jgi:hypothetical protein